MNIHTILAVINTDDITYTDGDLTGPVVTMHEDLASARAHFTKNYLGENDKMVEVDHGHKITLSISSRTHGVDLPSIIGSVTQIDW